MEREGGRGAEDLAVLGGGVRETAAAVTAQHPALDAAPPGLSHSGPR